MMTKQTIVHIGKVVRNAHIFNAQQWQGTPTSMDNLLQTVDNLFELLQQRKTKYVLVGGIALLQYIQGRNTEDIDLILNMTALRRLPEITITSQGMYFALSSQGLRAIQDIVLDLAQRIARFQRNQEHD